MSFIFKNKKILKYYNFGSNIFKKLIIKNIGYSANQSQINYRQANNSISYFWNIENKRLFIKNQKKLMYLKKKNKINNAKKLVSILNLIRFSRVNLNLFINFLVNSKNTINFELYNYLFNRLYIGLEYTKQSEFSNYFFKKYKYFLGQQGQHYIFENKHLISNRLGKSKIYLNKWMDNVVNSKIIDNFFYNEALIKKSKNSIDKDFISNNIVSTGIIDEVSNIFNIYKFKNQNYLKNSKIKNSFILPNIEKISAILLNSKIFKFSDFFKNIKYFRYKSPILNTYLNDLGSVFNSIFQNLDIFTIKHTWNSLDSVESADIVDSKHLDSLYLEFLNNDLDYDNFFSNTSNFEFGWKYFKQQDSQYIDEPENPGLKFISWTRSKLMDSLEDNFYINQSDSFKLDSKLNIILPTIGSETETLFRSKPITLYEEYRKDTSAFNSIDNKSTVLKKNKLNYNLNFENINMFEDRVLDGSENFSNYDYLRILENKNNWWEFSNILFFDKDSRDGEMGRSDNLDGTFSIDFDYNFYLQNQYFGYFFGESTVGLNNMDFEIKLAEMYGLSNINNFGRSLVFYNEIIDFEEDEYFEDFLFSDIYLDDISTGIATDIRILDTHEGTLGIEEEFTGTYNEEDFTESGFIEPNIQEDSSFGYNIIPLVESYGWADIEIIEKSKKREKIYSDEYEEGGIENEDPDEDEDYNEGSDKNKNSEEGEDLDENEDEDFDEDMDYNDGSDEDFEENEYSKENENFNEDENFEKNEYFKESEYYTKDKYLKENDFENKRDDITDVYKEYEDIKYLKEEDFNNFFVNNFYFENETNVLGFKKNDDSSDVVYDFLYSDFEEDLDVIEIENNTDFKNEENENWCEIFDNNLGNNDDWDDTDWDSDDWEDVDLDEEYLNNIFIDDEDFYVTDLCFYDNFKNYICILNDVESNLSIESEKDYIEDEEDSDREIEIDGGTEEVNINNNFYQDYNNYNDLDFEVSDIFSKNEYYYKENFEWLINADIEENEDSEEKNSEEYEDFEESGDFIKENIKNKKKKHNLEIKGYLMNKDCTNYDDFKTSFSLLNNYLWKDSEIIYEDYDIFNTFISDDFWFENLTFNFDFENSIGMSKFVEKINTNNSIPIWEKNWYSNIMDNKNSNIINNGFLREWLSDKFVSKKFNKSLAMYLKIFKIPSKIIYLSDNTNIGNSITKMTIKSKTLNSFENFYLNKIPVKYDNIGLENNIKPDNLVDNRAFFEELTDLGEVDPTSCEEFDGVENPFWVEFLYDSEDLNEDDQINNSFIYNKWKKPLAASWKPEIETDWLPESLTTSILNFVDDKLYNHQIDSEFLKTIIAYRSERILDSEFNKFLALEKTNYEYDEDLTEIEDIKNISDTYNFISEFGFKFNEEAEKLNKSLKSHNYYSYFDIKNLNSKIRNLEYSDVLENKDQSLFGDNLELPYVEEAGYKQYDNYLKSGDFDFKDIFKPNINKINKTTDSYSFEHFKDETATVNLTPINYTKLLKNYQLTDNKFKIPKNNYNLNGNLALKSDILEIKDREYGMIQFAEVNFPIQELSYWSTDNNDFYNWNDINDDHEIIIPNIFEKNIIIFKNKSDADWLDKEFNASSNNYQNYEYLSDMANKQNSYSSSEEFGNQNEFGQISGDFEFSNNKYSYFGSIENINNEGLNLKHIKKLDDLGKVGKIYGIDYNNHSGYLYNKKNGFQNISTQFDELNKKIITKNIDFGSSFYGVQSTPMIENFENITIKNTDTAFGFKSYNSLQKSLKSNSKQFNENAINNITTIRLLFKHFFENSNNGDSIFDDYMPSMVNNKLIWLSYIKPKTEIWDFKKSIKTHENLKTFNLSSAGKINSRKLPYYEFYDFYKNKNINYENKTINFDIKVPNSSYNDNTFINNITTLGIPVSQNMRTSISTTDADAYLRPTRSEGFTIKNDTSNSLKKTMLSSIYSIFSNGTDRKNIIEILQNSPKNKNSTINQFFNNDSNYYNNLATSQNNLESEILESTDFDDYSLYGDTGFGSIVDISNYLDIDVYGRESSLFWEMNNNVENSNFRETIRLNRWRKSLNSCRPIIFNAYGSLSRGYNMVVKPKFWWVPDQAIDFWVNSNKNLNLKQYTKKFKHIFENFENKLTKETKRLNPYDSFENNKISSNINAKVRSELFSKYSPNKLIDSHNFKIWKKMTEKKPLRRVIKKYNTLNILNNIKSNSITLWNFILKKTDINNIITSSSYSKNKFSFLKTNIKFKKIPTIQIEIKSNLLLNNKLTAVDIYKLKNFSKYGEFSYGKKNNNILENYNEFENYVGIDGNAIKVNINNHSILNKSNIWFDYSSWGKSNILFWENSDNWRIKNMLNSNSYSLNRINLQKLYNKKNQTFNFEDLYDKLLSIREFRFFREISPIFENNLYFSSNSVNFKEIKNINNVRMYSFQNIKVLNFFLNEKNMYSEVFQKFLNFFKMYYFIENILFLIIKNKILKNNFVFSELSNILKFLSLGIYTDSLFKIKSAISWFENFSYYLNQTVKIKKKEYYFEIFILNLSEYKVILNIDFFAKFIKLLLLHRVYIIALDIQNLTNFNENYFFKILGNCEIYDILLKYFSLKIKTSKNIFFNNNTNIFNLTNFLKNKEYRNYFIYSENYNDYLDMNLEKKLKKIINKNIYLNFFNNIKLTLPNIDFKDIFYELMPKTDKISDFIFEIYDTKKNKNNNFSEILNSSNLLENSENKSIKKKQFYNIFEKKRWLKFNKKLIINITSTNSLNIDWLCNTQIVYKIKTHKYRSSIRYNKFKKKPMSLFKYLEFLPFIITKPKQYLNTYSYISNYKKTNNDIIVSLGEKKYTHWLELSENQNYFFNENLENKFLKLPIIFNNKKTKYIKNFFNFLEFYENWQKIIFTPTIKHDTLFWKNEINIFDLKTTIYSVSDIFNISYFRKYKKKNKIIKYNYFINKIKNNINNLNSNSIQNNFLFFKNINIIILNNNLKTYKFIYKNKFKFEFLNKKLIKKPTYFFKKKIANNLTSKNIEYLNKYYWARLASIKNYNKSIFLKNSNIDSSTTSINSVLSNIADVKLNGNVDNTNLSVEDLNIFDNLENFQNSYSSAKNLSKVSNYDLNLLYSLNIQKNNNNSVFDLFINSTQFNNLTIKFFINKFDISLLKNIFLLNPENFIYNLWDNTFTSFKQLKNNDYKKFIKNNLFFKSGHINPNIIEFKILLFRNKLNMDIGGLFEKFITIKYSDKNISVVNSHKFLEKIDYKNWSKNFGLFENKFSNTKSDLNSIRNSISQINKNNTKLIHKINIGTETAIQRLEQMYINHLGNNFIRELIYSHYGSWIPKYGFFAISENLNPDNLSKFSKKNLDKLDKYINNGDWVKYFEYKKNIKNNGELNFIKKYIFIKNTFLSKDLYSNFSEYSIWSKKKIIYRPFDSYVSLNNHSNGCYSDFIFSKIWGWTVRDDYSLRYNFFKSWYINQLFLEKKDILKYGKILPKTINLRKLNPEMLYINDVNFCIGNFLISNVNSDKMFQYSELDRYFLNKKLKSQIIRCFSNKNVNLNSQNNKKISIDSSTLSLNQTEITMYLSEHDLAINKYRYDNWKKIINKKNA